MNFNKIKSLSAEALESASDSSEGDEEYSTVVFPDSIKDDLFEKWNFDEIHSSSMPKVDSLPVTPENEKRLLSRDILFPLLESCGCLIEPENQSYDNSNPIKFKIGDGVNDSKNQIALEILRLADYHVCIENFIDKVTFSNCGQVLQALGAELRLIISDYFLLLTNLSNEDLYGNLSLAKLLFYIRPTLNIMELLAGITKSRGCLALNLLLNKIVPLNSDKELQELLIKLTKKTTAPFMYILNLWIHKGIIDDPQNDFMIVDNKMICKDAHPTFHNSADYWEKKYTILKDNVPNFLKNLEDVILRTGKYLNVMRQCGKLVVAPQEEVQLNFLSVKQTYESIIRDIYLFASKNLLDFLIKEMDLMGYIKSVRRYFLQYQGDFIDQFMDVCEYELSKIVGEVFPMKLKYLLEFTLRISSAKFDVYKEFLHCELLNYDLVRQMTKIINKEEEFHHAHDRTDLFGFECFAFTYEVKWPVSLVLNNISISKYQMLFRQLFYCKHVERQLCKIWKEIKTSKKFFPQPAKFYRSSFILLQRMLCAIQNLLNYMMIEVIEPNWQNFIVNIKTAENIDDVLEVHEDFLDSCLKNCMLTKTNFVKLINKLCTVCLDFCKFNQNLISELPTQNSPFLNDENFFAISKSNGPDSPEFTKIIYNSEKSETLMSPSKQFNDSFHRLDCDFTELLRELLEQVTKIALESPSDRYIGLVRRINFNSFYIQQADTF